MEKKLNPLQMVARELTEQTDMQYDRIEDALIGLVNHLNERALIEINKNEYSDDAKNAAMQYRVFVETIAIFGAQLIAFEDMEDDLPARNETN